MATEAKDAPSTRSAAALAMRPAWDLLTDVLAGTRQMRNAAAKYLPRMEVETVRDYDARVARTPFYNATDRTLEGLVGLAFRAPPKLNPDADARLKAHAEDIDGEGTHFEVFAKRAMDSGVAYGFGAILVDYAAVDDPEAVTMADEKAGNLRPYWVNIAAPQICSLRTIRDGARTVLQQIVIEEKVADYDGEFGEAVTCQYRRLVREARNRIRWEVWREVDKAWSVTKGYFSRQPEIPVALFYTGRKLGDGLAQVPLENLAWANVAHFQVASDHRNSLHIAGVPILVRFGVQQHQSNAVAASLAWDLPETARVEWVEHKGMALSESRTELRDIEQQMANLGLAMLAAQPRAVETAEAKRIDAAAQNSQLATAARALQDALELAWQFHALYLGATPPEVAWDTDFERLTLEAADIAAYSAMVTAGQLSVETMWQRLVQGGALPDDFNPEEERERIDGDTLPPDPPQIVMMPPPGAAPGATQDAPMPDPTATATSNGAAPAPAMADA